MLDGPLIVRRATAPGRCPVCSRRYLKRARVGWLEGSGWTHAECLPAATVAGLMRAARFLASGARDRDELLDWLQAVGLLAASPGARHTRQTRRREPAGSAQ